MLTPNIATMYRWLNNQYPGVVGEAQDFLQIGNQSSGVIEGWIDELGIPRGTLATRPLDGGAFSFTEVPYSATPDFEMTTANNAFQLIMNGSVTSSTVSGVFIPGTVAEFNIVNTGDYTFAWPSNFTNAPVVLNGAVGQQQTDAL